MFDHLGDLHTLSDELVDTIIGLFHGMLDGNVMTFNPGWDRDEQTSSEFTDVREIQAELEARGVELAQRAEPGSGPGFLSLTDPDGNVILIDQHV